MGETILIHDNSRVNFQKERSKMVFWGEILLEVTSFSNFIAHSEGMQNKIYNNKCKMLEFKSL
jgi:hypothetical protein